MEKSVAIEARGLMKRYDNDVAIGALNFEVLQGECFGLLGPNGAGKSTAIRMMYGSSLIDQGDLFILGLNIKNSGREIRSQIGVVPTEDGLETELSVRENLILFGRYHGIEKNLLHRRCEDLLKLVKLEEYADHRVPELPVGFRQRLVFARALINEPRILFLDEPTLSLDPSARQWVWNQIQNEKAQGRTLLLTTHDMEEAEKICDRIAIMDRGKVLAVGTPRELIQRLVGTQVIELQVPRGDLQYYLSRLSSHNFAFQVVKQQVNVHLKDNDDPQRVMNLVQGISLTLRQSGLSDVFFKLSGHDVRDELI
ncbi:MAG: ABC transporter ATP-binding protein [Bdellovibrio sp. CG10_big_fil_rev_8_21_14_0_10_47_8]|nr:MAG: ABC transporter ATP-binding protein [Bdellovibrio sp. CG10_big_fil_rev_8_21_14_0_10_47_8]